ncbi:MAG: threonine synthase [Actinobacteria bacterium]|nr:threonine synthase [Actinomycetota bacterium]MBU1493814.1 threonine synthase [Actinomycetota bacterium]
MTAWPGVIEAYRDRLPVSEATPVITLLEGATPLIPAPHLSELVGRPVLLKYEGVNPTGSFKDRGMTLAVSKAVEEGATAVACASTGNTSASAAAYAARAGIECLVVLPAGNVALGKLAQAIRHGARVVAVDGSFDDALELVRKVTVERPIVLVNSINPYRIVGQQSGAWEVLDALGEAPAVHALPVGNAGNITAYWRGYGIADSPPAMWGFQAAGAAPLVHGAPVARPETVATAIRIGSPASWAGAVAARDESGGRIEAVTDDEILSAYRLLAAREGVFAEPASAASVAGVLKYQADLPDGVVVCTLTGHGLKDPDTAMRSVPPPGPIPPTMTALAAHLGW